MQPNHSFGGSWTETKLKVLSGYLQAYTIALKNKRFKKLYIDAFAGTGYRTVTEGSLFQESIDDQVITFLEGSARIALQLDPSFDIYVFIEKSETRCKQLEKLREEFPDKDIRIIRADANECLGEMCYNIKWKSHRAVLFLDPYGMEVKWSTIEKVSKTAAIDMWYLFPLSVNRLLRKDGIIPEEDQKRLSELFGTDDWYNEFYLTNYVNNLFEEETETIEKIGDFNKISRYIVKRLKTAFPGVAKNPLALYNSKQNPLFLFCFACSNKKGSPVALKIAEHILKGL